MKQLTELNRRTFVVDGVVVVVSVGSIIIFIEPTTKVNTKTEDEQNENEKREIENNFRNVSETLFPVLTLNFTRTVKIQATCWKFANDSLKPVPRTM